jgi:hypothetical protein
VKTARKFFIRCSLILDVGHALQTEMLPTFHDERSRSKSTWAFPDA